MDVVARLRTSPADSAVAAVLAALGLVQVVVWPIAPGLLGEAFVVGSTLPLAWRRTVPATAALVSSVFWLIPLDGYPVLGFVVVVVQFYSLGRWADPWARVLLVGLAAAALSVVGTLLGPEAPVAAIGGVLAVVAPAAAGRIVRHQHQQNEALEELTRELAVERRRAEDAARGAERARIAREMHDVLGHEITLIAIQAEAAGAALRSDPTRATEPVEAIRANAHRTLQEMRSLLGVLHETEDQPTNEEDLAQVAERARALGVDNELVETGVPLPRNNPVSLAVQRIARECLTNAGRHGRGSLSMRVDWDHDQVRLHASNPSRRGRRRREGRGLLGIRHRAELLGGTCQVHNDGDVFEVDVTIPVRRS